MDEDLRKTSWFTSTNLSPHTFAKVNEERPDDKPPTEVSETVFYIIEREGRYVRWVGSVADKASGGMGVETDHEEES